MSLHLLPEESLGSGCKLAIEALELWLRRVIDLALVPDFGDDHIEIEGPANTNMDALKRTGWTVEIVSFRARIFSPIARAIERILERWPLAA